MAIDPTRLAEPAVVEEISFDEIFQALLDDLVARDAEYTAITASDPAWPVLEACAYREMNLRQRFNDRARGLLLAFASDADLDHIGTTYYFTERLIIDEGDPEADPPIEPTLESDQAYLDRILLSVPAYSTAGAREAYEFHARTADGQVKNASATRPDAGEVLVTVLAHDGDGTPDSELLDIVDAALSDEDVRPLTDHPTVQAADVQSYDVDATIHVDPSADSDDVRAAALENVQNFVEAQHRLGRTLYREAVLARLYVAGVRWVELTEPAADIDRDDTQAAFCASVTIEAVEYE